MENKKRYIGIDMSKRSIETVFITKNEEILTRMRIKNNPEGQMALIKNINASDVIWLETGNSSFLFAKLLKEKTASKVFVLNAEKLHIIFNSLKKTDKEEALQIASLLARVPEEQLPGVHIPETHEMEERSCVAENSRLQRMITQFINALHNLLWNNGITDLKRKDLMNAEHRLSGIYYKQALRISKQLDLFEQQHEEIVQEQLMMNKNHLKHTCISMSTLVSALKKPSLSEHILVQWNALSHGIK